MLVCACRTRSTDHQRVQRYAPFQSTAICARLGIRDILWMFFAYKKNARPNWDANSWQDVLPDDTISLRHLPRRSSKNCDLQSANVDWQTDRFKANYSIDKHSSVQTRWYRLQEHLREHLLAISTLVDPQLHRMSWRTAPGAGVSFISNGRSLTYCIWHLSVMESGTTEFTIRSWHQTLHWTCARRMCSNQTIRVVGSLSTPWSGFSYLKRCHPTVFAWDVWSCSGQKTEHKNFSDPLNTWTDGYAPSPSSVTAAYDCVLLCLWLLLSLCHVLALSREPGAGHHFSVSTCGP